MLKPAQSWHSALIFLEGLRKSLTVSPSGFSSCLDAGSTDIIQHWGQSLSSFKPLNRVSHLWFCLSAGVLHTCAHEVLSQIFVESSFRPFKNKKIKSLFVHGFKDIQQQEITFFSWKKTKQQQRRHNFPSSCRTSYLRHCQAQLRAPVVGTSGSPVQSQWCEVVRSAQ